MLNRLKIINVINILNIILILIFNSNAYAKNSYREDFNTVTIASFQDMDNQIFIEPWLSLQALSKLAPQYSNMSQEEKVWWLLRKAQCEDLLYFYEKFDQTLLEIEPLISVQSSIEQQARFNHFKGLSLQRAGGYKKSRVYFEKAMSLAKQQNLNHIYIKAKLEFAYTYSLAELFETSLKDMQEAYVEAFALNDQFLVAMINETYGAIYGYMHDNEKSLEYYQKALESYESLGYKAHVAEAIYGIATTYRYWEKYELAIEKFKLYQQSVSYTPNAEITYFGAYGLGMSLAEDGQCVEALNVIDHAIKLTGLDDYDAELYKRKTSCLIELKRFDEAEKTLDILNKTFQSLPELMGTAWQIETLKIASSLESAQGNYQKGYELLVSYNQQYIDLLMKNSSSRIIKVRANMELERQDIEKALSNQRSKADLLEIKNREQKSLQQSYFIIFLSTVLVIVIAVVTFQFKNNRKMANLAITDPLSGLYNRRYIFQYLDKLISSTSPNKGELSILVIDIDDFKLINDTYGHPMGDAVLKVLAEILQHLLRVEDMMGRIGGEEFLCVLPRTSSEVGEKIAHRMKEEISQYVFKNEEGITFTITISIGVSSISQDVHDSKALYSLADKALYEAKTSGKNCVNIL
ncbi:MAG: GGDEF domain-containing protein [Colwelliaceae bacterium]|nr:GGDEF domain-containing protein [Colwelliaceae bacterium]